MPTTYAIPNGRTAMTVTLYTGTGSTLTISNTDLGTVGFTPDFVWEKNRTGTNWHALFDTVRGRASGLASNAADAQSTSSAGNDLVSFNSNGFTVGPNQNWGGLNSGSDVAWQWNAGSNTSVSNTSGTITSTVSANVTSGFSIVTYTGNGTTSASVGHGLGATPSWIFVKRRDTTAQDWGVYNAAGGLKLLQLNTTNAYWNSSSNYWYSAPTSTVFYPDNTYGDHYQNINGATYVAYCWAPVPGFSAFGSYTGNGSTDGPFIYTGFRPRFILYKPTNVGTPTDWVMWDTSRNPYNVLGNYLLANTNGSEGTATILDILSNGFKLRTTSTGNNGSGDNIVYMAFAENPFKYANAR